MRFDGSAINRALEKMEKLQKKKGKIMMKKHGRFFVNRTRRVAREHMPTPAIITAEAQVLGNRIKRRGKAKTAAQELARRIKAIGLFARGWRFWKFDTPKDHIRLWIHDTIGYAESQDSKYSPSVIAADQLRGEFAAKMQRMMDEIAKEFNA
jgi:hypothetical protein